MASLIKGDYYRLSDAYGNSVLYRAISEKRLKKANTPIGELLLGEWQPEIFSLQGLRIEHLPGMKIFGDDSPAA